MATMNSQQQPGPSWPPDLEWLEARTILLTVGGSRAYGTNLEDSDRDVRGICVAPNHYYHGFRQKFEQAQFRGGRYDTIVFDVRKFFRLAAEASPNVLEVLFTHPRHQLRIHPAGQKLLDCRDLFLTQRVARSFGGFARGQIHRLNASIREFGAYDGKAASHGIRLLRMGSEILMGEGVKVFRADAYELLAIRQGRYSSAQLLDECRTGTARLEMAMKLTRLPENPDYKKLDDLCVQVVESCLDLG